mmetsp:Transcript_21062/g.34791  ORF Transcript_21062/g.34791 Transcript_21062/m.34791 type:complete len:896 (+) Transcript_21062:61-2748(+)
MRKIWLLICIGCICVLHVACQSQPIKLEADIDGKVASLKSDLDFQVVFIRSSKNTIYRSTDGGQHWSDESSKMTGFAGITEFYLSPADPKKVFFLGFGTKHFVTKDQGETYQAVGNIVNTDRALRLFNVKLHPQNSDLVLGGQYSRMCYGESASGDETGCNAELYLSRDFGKTWNRVARYITDFAWSDPKLGSYNPNTAFFVSYRQNMQHGEQNFNVPWDVASDLFRTDNLFASVQTSLDHGVGMRWVNDFFFVAWVDPQEPSALNLQVSRDNGKTFKDAVFPYKLSESGYTVLDTSDGAVFISVNHGCDGTWGNLYLSNADGSRFSLSLRSQTRQSNGHADFEKVHSLEGVYFANYIANHQTGPSYLPQPTGADRVVRSRVSFDKGGQWHKIRPPSVDALGVPYKDGDKTCDEVWKTGPHGVPEDSPCQLHLTSREHEDLFSRPESHMNATGLVMAIGSVGSQLDAHRDKVNTYFSRDGGVSWVEIAKGSNELVYGDYGGVMVIVDDSEETTDLKYSWNEGKTWTVFSFSSTPMEIDELITPPGLGKKQFILYGTRAGHGHIVYLDFSSTSPRQCAGEAVPDAADSDYEKWSPGTGSTDQPCLLGRQVTYTRRKKDVECFNGQSFEPKTFIKNCACTEEDFECAYGFERDDDEGPCQALYGNGLLGSLTCPDGSILYASKPYERVAGDSCDINDPSVTEEFRRQHVLYQPECPPPPRRGHAWVGWLIGIFVVSGVFGCAFLAYRNRDHESMESLRGMWETFETKIKGGMSGKFTSVRYSGLRGDDHEAGLGLMDDQDDADAPQEIASTATAPPSRRTGTISYAGGAGLGRERSSSGPIIVPSTTNGTVGTAATLIDFGGPHTGGSANSSPGSVKPLPPPPRTGSGKTPLKIVTD